MTALDTRGGDWDDDENVAPTPVRRPDVRGGYRWGDDGPDWSDDPGPPAAFGHEQAAIRAGLRRREVGL